MQHSCFDCAPYGRYAQEDTGVMRLPFDCAPCGRYAQDDKRGMRLPFDFAPLRALRSGRQTR